MADFLRHLKTNIGAVDKDGIPRGWIIKYDKKDNIREIKSLFNPTLYTGKRPVYTDQELVDKLESHRK